MIYIPLASILVFVATFAISIYLGYKRGWRAALFISILFLTLNAIVLVIESAIFKSVLWDLYKKLFMKNEMKTQGIDYDLLSSHYKVRVLLVFGGFISPLTYALTFGIYFALKKPLYNYLMPRVKEISSNEKELVYRKNPKPARIVGATISGTTALFAASYFASAANVLVTPREHQNGFNKFNDVLGRIYTFGLGGNTDETKAISQFLRQVDGDFVNDVKKLINFDFSKSEFAGWDDSSNPKASPNDAVSKELDKYKFLFESEEATNAIFAAIVSKVEAAKFNVIDFGFDVSKDKDNNFIGVDQGNGKRKIDILSKFVATHSIVASELPLSARIALFERLKQGLSTWEDTEFFKQLKEATDNQTAQRAEITRLKGVLTSKTKSRAEAETEQEHLVSDIYANAGFKSSVTPETNNNVVLEDGSHPINSNIKTISETSVSVDRSNNTTTALAGSKIDLEFKKELELKTDFETKQKIYEDAKAKRVDYENNKFNPINSKYNELKAARDSAESTLNADRSQLNSINSTLSRLRTELSNLKTERSTLQTKVAQLTTTIANLETKLSNTKTAQAAAEAKAQQAQTALNAADVALTRANAAVTTAQNIYNNQKAVLDNAKVAESTAKSAMQQAEAHLKTLSQTDPQYPAAQAAYQSAVAAHNDAVAEVNKQTSTLNNYKGVLDTATKEAATAQSTFNTKQNELTSAQNASSSAMTATNNAQQELNNAKAEKSTAESRLSAIAIDIPDHESQISSADAQRIKYEGIVAADQSKLQDATNKMNNFKVATSPIDGFDYGYDKALSELNKLKQDESNKESIKNAAQSAYEKQKTLVDGLVSTTNQDISSLVATNSEIREYNSSIDFLRDHDLQYTFSKTADNADWSHGQEAENEKSIYFAEQKLLYWDNKVEQRTTISNEMKTNYNNLNNWLISDFKLYTIPDER